MLSESGPDGYDASAWSCSAGTLAGDTLTLAAGDVANCTITNDDTPAAPAPATIMVDKLLPAPSWGGTLVAGDFQLLIDGVNATQSDAARGNTGTHTIGEQARDGYVQAGIVCIDLATAPDADPLSTDGTVTVAAGQNAHCIVGNMEDPADVDADKVRRQHEWRQRRVVRLPAADRWSAGRSETALPLMVGTHTIAELPTAGYRLVSIDCTDDDTQLPVTYNTASRWP